MATISASEALITQADLSGVLGGLWNGKNYSGTFIPTVWSSKLNQKFYAHSTFAAVANTDWEGDIKNLGDKVVINGIPSISVADYVVGTDLTYEVPTPTTQELPIDKAKYFAFQVNDVLVHQSKIEMMDMFSTDAGQQLKIAIDTDCWLGVHAGAAAANKGAAAGAISGAYNLGTDAAPVALNAGNVLAKITELSSVLDEALAPDDGRWLVITPYERQLLMNSNLAQAQFMGDSQSALRNGKIGRIDRFDIYLTTLLPKAAVDKDYVGGTDSGKPKRHVILAGHRSALTMASQINKVETLRNPRDFGDFVRGLMVYGRKVVLDTAMSSMIVAG
jgi:hypothetical protein